MSLEVSDFVQFCMLNQGIFFCEPLLMLLLVVKVALVVLSISVLAAEHIITLAGESEKPNLSFAGPTETFISL